MDLMKGNKIWLRLITLLVITTMVCQNIAWAGGFREGQNLIGGNTHGKQLLSSRSIFEDFDKYFEAKEIDLPYETRYRIFLGFNKVADGIFKTLPKKNSFSKGRMLLKQGNEEGIYKEIIRLFEIDNPKFKKYIELHKDSILVYEGDGDKFFSIDIDFKESNGNVISKRIFFYKPDNPPIEFLKKNSRVWTNEDTKYANERGFWIISLVSEKEIDRLKVILEDSNIYLGKRLESAKTLLNKNKYYEEVCHFINEIYNEMEDAFNFKRDIPWIDDLSLIPILKDIYNMISEAPDRPGGDLVHIVKMGIGLKIIEIMHEIQKFSLIMCDRGKEIYRMSKIRKGLWGQTIAVDKPRLYKMAEWVRNIIGLVKGNEESIILQEGFPPLCLDLLRKTAEEKGFSILLDADNDLSGSLCIYEGLSGLLDKVNICGADKMLYVYLIKIDKGIKAGCDKEGYILWVRKDGKRIWQDKEPEVFKLIKSKIKKYLEEMKETSYIKDKGIEIERISLIRPDVEGLIKDGKIEAFEHDACLPFSKPISIRINFNHLYTYYSHEDRINIMKDIGNGMSEGEVYIIGRGMHEYIDYAVFQKIGNKLIKIEERFQEELYKITKKYSPGVIPREVFPKEILLAEKDEEKSDSTWICSGSGMEANKEEREELEGMAHEYLKDAGREGRIIRIRGPGKKRIWFKDKKLKEAKKFISKCASDLPKDISIALVLGEGGYRIVTTSEGEGCIDAFMKMIALNPFICMYMDKVYDFENIEDTQPLNFYWGLPDTWGRLNLLIQKVIRDRKIWHMNCVVTSILLFYKIYANINSINMGKEDKIIAMEVVNGKGHTWVRVKFANYPDKWVVLDASNFLSTEVDPKKYSNGYFGEETCITLKDGSNLDYKSICERPMFLEHKKEQIGFSHIGEPGSKDFMALTAIGGSYSYKGSWWLRWWGKTPYTIYLKLDDVLGYMELGERGKRGLSAKLNHEYNDAQNKLNGLPHRHTEEDNKIKDLINECEGRIINRRLGISIAEGIKEPSIPCPVPGGENEIAITLLKGDMEQINNLLKREGGRLWLEYMMRMCLIYEPTYKIVNIFNWVIELELEDELSRVFYESLEDIDPAKAGLIIIRLIEKFGSPLIKDGTPEGVKFKSIERTRQHLMKLGGFLIDITKKWQLDPKDTTYLKAFFRVKLKDKASIKQLNLYKKEEGLSFIGNEEIGDIFKVSGEPSERVFQLILTGKESNRLRIDFPDDLIPYIESLLNMKEFFFPFRGLVIKEIEKRKQRKVFSYMKRREFIKLYESIKSKGIRRNIVDFLTECHQSYSLDKYKAELIPIAMIVDYMGINLLLMQDQSRRRGWLLARNPYKVIGFVKGDELIPIDEVYREKIEGYISNLPARELKHFYITPFDPNKLMPTETFIDLVGEGRDWFYLGHDLALINEVKEAISNTEGPISIVDIGCGGGELLLHLLEEFSGDERVRLFGIEPEQKLLTLARIRLPGDVKLSKIPAEKLSEVGFLNDLEGSFKIAISEGVITVGVTQPDKGWGIMEEMLKCRFDKIFITGNTPVYLDPNLLKLLLLKYKYSLDQTLYPKNLFNHNLPKIMFILTRMEEIPLNDALEEIYTILRQKKEFPPLEFIGFGLEDMYHPNEETILNLLPIILAEAMKKPPQQTIDVYRLSDGRFRFIKLEELHFSKPVDKKVDSESLMERFERIAIPVRLFWHSGTGYDIIAKIIGVLGRCENLIKYYIQDDNIISDLKEIIKNITNGREILKVFYKEVKEVPIKLPIERIQEFEEKLWTMCELFKEAYGGYLNVKGKLLKSAGIQDFIYSREAFELFKETFEKYQDAEPKKAPILRFVYSMEDLNFVWNRVLLNFVEGNLQKEEIYFGGLVKKAISSLWVMDKNLVEKMVEINIPSDIKVYVDEVLFSLAIARILSNGAHFAKDINRILVTAEKKDDEIIIKIEDDGKGFPEDLLKEVYQDRQKALLLNVTTRNGGTGFGLVFLWHVIKAHGGDIVISNSSSLKEGGACITIRVPKYTGVFGDKKEEAINQRGHEVKVIHPKTGEIGGFVEELKKQYPPTWVNAIGNMLKVDEIKVEVDIKNLMVKKVGIKKIDGLGERDKRFIREQIRAALNGDERKGIRGLLNRDNLLPQALPDGRYKIRITPEYDSLGNIKFLPHTTQDELDLSPLAFLRPVLLQYALRHEMDHAMDTESKDEDESEVKVRQNDRLFFADLSFENRLYLLFTFSGRDQPIKLSLESIQDILPDLLNIFAEKNKISKYAWRTEEKVEKIIEDYGKRFKVPQRKVDYSLWQEVVSGISIGDVIEMPSIIKRLVPSELVILQEKGEKFPKWLFEEAFHRYKGDLEELAYLFLYLSGLKGKGHVELAAEVLHQYFRIRSDLDRREYRLEFFFTLAFRDESLINNRDKIIRLIMEEYSSEYDKKAKEGLCEFFFRCFREEDEKYISGATEGLSPIWQAELNTYFIRREKGGLSNLPDYIKGYIIENGSFCERAIIGDFSWVRDWVDFNDPEFNIRKTWTYFSQKAGNNDKQADDLHSAFEVFLINPIRYKYIPPKIIDSLTDLYWKGLPLDSFGYEDLSGYKWLIDQIGNDPRGRAIKFLKQVIGGEKKRKVVDERYEKRVSDSERKEALEIYSKRLGRNAVPQLIEWFKREDFEKEFESLIMEKILENLTYQEILESLGSPLLDEGEEEHTVYKKTIINIDQAIRHLDVLWDRLMLKEIKGKKRSKNKAAFKDVKEAIDDIKIFMPIARKVKFHILETNEFLIYQYGNHICISEGALRFIRRKSSLRLVLAHEIAHRERRLVNLLQRIKSNQEFKDPMRISLETFISKRVLGELMFIPELEDEADRRAIEVVVKLGYSADSALKICQDTHFVRTLIGGASPRILGLHPNQYSRMMNMKGEGLRYELNIPKELKKEDSYLRFVQEENDPIKTTRHAFSVIGRNWHSAPASCKELAIGDWLHYVQEYIRDAIKIKDKDNFHPVEELIKLNRHYQNFRPLWLAPGEMIVDFLPFDLIDEIIEKDSRYQGFSGLREVYQRLGMISPPEDKISISRTARVLYHLAHQDLYKPTLNDWLDTVKPISAKVLKKRYEGEKDIILQYAHAMLSAFIFGLDLVHKSGDFGESFEKDLAIIRQLAGLPDNKDAFAVYQGEMRKQKGRNTVKGAFGYHYDKAIKEIIQRHYVSLANPEKEKEVDLAIQFCLNPGDIIHCLYEVGSKEKMDVLEKMELFFKTIEKAISLGDLANIDIWGERYGTPWGGKYVNLGIYKGTVVEEEARGLFKEVYDKGLMNNGIEDRFYGYFGYNHWGNRNPLFKIERYYNNLKAELVKVIKEVEPKKKISETFLNFIEERCDIDGLWDYRHVKYDLQSFISLAEWIISEKLDYDPESSLPIVVRIKEVMRIREELMNDKIREDIRSIVDKIFENIIRRIEDNTEDKFSFDWFDNFYKEIINIAGVFGFTSKFIDSVEGARYEGALSKLSQFPEIEEKYIGYKDVTEEERRSERFYKYKSIQAASYLKKTKKHKRQFCKIGLDRELNYIIENMGKHKRRDELLLSLINRSIEDIGAERLLQVSEYFSKDGSEYKVDVIKEVIRKIFETNHDPIGLAIDYVLRSFDKRCKYRDQLIDYVMSLASLPKEEILKYETLKTRFGEETLKEAEADLFIKNLELISQLEPEMKLELLLWIKGIGPRPRYFTIEGRADIAASKRMDPEIRKMFLNLSDDKLLDPDRFNKEFNKLHKQDRKEFFIELLGRPDGILSDSKVKKQFIQKEIWKLFETVDKDSPEGKLITIYLEEADPLTSARVLAEILDISFEGLTNYQRLALLLLTIGFIGDKTAQFFSVRLERPEARCAFRDAQRRPRPFPKIEAVEILEEEWNKPINEVLKNGLGKELGYGSSKGVWEAELMDGRKVAISVQRPKFKLEMDYQFYLVDKVLKRFKKTKYGKEYSGLIAETMDVNKAMLEGESDLKTEVMVRNRLAETIEGIHLPKVLEEFTTQRVVVTELISPSTRLNEIEDVEIRQKVIKKVIEAMIYQLIHHGVFHADPWPSNILVDPEENVHFIDFAVGGIIPEEYLAPFIDLIKGMISGNIEEIANQLEDLTDCYNEPKALSLKDIKNFLLQVSSSNSVVDMWINLLELLYKNNRRFKHGLRVELAKLLRTLGILEGLEISCNAQGYLLERLLKELCHNANLTCGTICESGHEGSFRERVEDFPKEQIEGQPPSTPQGGTGREIEVIEELEKEIRIVTRPENIGREVSTRKNLPERGKGPPIGGADGGEKKVLYIVLDGMPDTLLVKELGRKTPLQAANIPNLDKLAKHGILGLVHPVRKGHAPESDEAVLCMLGYPYTEYPGRGIIEVLGTEEEMPEGGIAMRVNFATGKKKGEELLIFDRRAGRNLTSEEAVQLAKEINEKVKLSHGAKFRFIPTVQHRGILILSVPAKTLNPMISNTDPGYKRQDHSMASVALSEGAFEYKVQKVEPTKGYEDDGSALLTVELLNEFSQKCYEVLDGSQVNKQRIKQTIQNLKRYGVEITAEKLIEKGISPKTMEALLTERNPSLKDKKEELKKAIIDTYVPPANLVIGRNASGKPASFKRLNEKFGLDAAAIVQMPVEMGIAKLLGMTPIEIPPTSNRPRIEELKENYDMFRTKILENMDKFDLLYAHIKGPDIPGHDGEAKEKVRILEAIDEYFLGPLLTSIDLDNTVIVVTADHTTSVAKKGHTGHPVPTIIYAKGLKPDLSRTFSETAAKKQVKAGRGLGEIMGPELLPKLVALAKESSPASSNEKLGNEEQEEEIDPTAFKFPETGASTLKVLEEKLGRKVTTADLNEAATRIIKELPDIYEKLNIPKNPAELTITKKSGGTIKVGNVLIRPTRDPPVKEDLATGKIEGGRFVIKADKRLLNAITNDYKKKGSCRLKAKCALRCLIRHEYVENGLDHPHYLTSAVDRLAEGTALHPLMQYALDLMNKEQIEAILLHPDHPNDPDREVYESAIAVLEAKMKDVEGMKMFADISKSISVEQVMPYSTLDNIEAIFEYKDRRRKLKLAVIKRIREIKYEVEHYGYKMFLNALEAKYSEATAGYKLTGNFVLGPEEIETQIVDGDKTVGRLPFAIDRKGKHVHYKKIEIYHREKGYNTLANALLYLFLLREGCNGFTISGTAFDTNPDSKYSKRAFFRIFRYLNRDYTPDGIKVSYNASIDSNERLSKILIDTAVYKDIKDIYRNMEQTSDYIWEDLFEKTLLSRLGVSQGKVHIILDLDFITDTDQRTVLVGADLEETDIVFLIQKNIEKRLKVISNKANCEITICSGKSKDDLLAKARLIKESTGNKPILITTNLKVEEIAKEDNVSDYIKDITAVTPFVNLRSGELYRTIYANVTPIVAFAVTKSLLTKEDFESTNGDSLLNAIYKLYKTITGTKLIVDRYLADTIENPCLSALRFVLTILPSPERLFDSAQIEELSEYEKELLRAA